MISAGKILWVRNISSMRRKRIPYGTCLESKNERPILQYLAIPRCRWEGNIKSEMKGIC
jgi:hypothetical protein